MTRAADRLIICGADGRTKRPERCWYDLVRGPLEAFLVEEDDGGEKVLRFRKTPAGAVAAIAPAAAPRKTRAARISGVAAAAGARRSAASRAAVALVGFRRRNFARSRQAAGSAADRQKALERGRLVHRLMQVAARYSAPSAARTPPSAICGNAADFLPAERAEMARQVLAILDDKNFAEIFAPGSRAEVPIVGRIARARARPDPRRRAGRPPRRHGRYGADRRLQDRPDRSGPARRCARPMSPSSRSTARCCPASIPGKTVRAALLFTDGPKLMEVPAAAMDKALDAALTKLSPGA